jgi:hypothetical protein
MLTASASQEGPSARVFPGMVHHLERGRILLIGGSDGLGTRADLWEWDGLSMCVHSGAQFTSKPTCGARSGPDRPVLAVKRRLPETCNSTSISSMEISAVNHAPM